MNLRAVPEPRGRPRGGVIMNLRAVPEPPFHKPPHPWALEELAPAKAGGTAQRLRILAAAWFEGLTMRKLGACGLHIQPSS